MATYFGKIGEVTPFRHADAGNGSNIAMSIFKHNGNILAIFCANLIKIGPVIREITR